MDGVTTYPFYIMGDLTLIKKIEREFEFIGLFQHPLIGPSTPIHSRAETIAANSSGS
jgi:hypothetical protein